MVKEIPPNSTQELAKVKFGIPDIPTIMKFPASLTYAELAIKREAENYFPKRPV